MQGKITYLCGNLLVMKKTTYYKIPEERSMVVSEAVSQMYTTTINWQNIDAIKRMTNYNDDVLADWFNVNVKRALTTKFYFAGKSIHKIFDAHFFLTL